MAGEPLAFQEQRAKSIRPDKSENNKYLQPMIEETGGAEIGGEDGWDADEEPNEQAGGWDAIAEKVDDLTKRVTEYMDDDNARERHAPPCIKALRQPTREEYDRHQSIHTPYGSWCRHCAMARAVRTQHRTKGRKTIIVPDIERGFKGPTKTSMDYTFLCDRSENRDGEPTNPPHLVAVEHEHGRAWAYQVPNKGVMGGAHWLPKNLVNDWDNNGLRDAIIQLKIDQEPSIVTLQAAIQEIRERGVIPTNSLVGESECNGRLENSIRRVQEKVRVLRNQIELNIKQRVSNDSNIMPWFVRWAAEIISKYVPGEDGRTPYERIRQEKCMVPLVPFDETVLYVPL